MPLIFMWSNQNIYSWPSIIYYTCFSILLLATWFICLHQLLFPLIIHNWSNQTCCLTFLLRLSVSEPLLINETGDFYFWVLLLYSTISLFCLMVVDTFFFQSYNVCLFYQKINWKWIFIWTLFILIHITLFFFLISYSYLCYPL